MKTQKMYLLKIQLLLFVILFTSACAQTEKNTVSTTNKSANKQEIQKPTMNIHSAIIAGNLAVVKQHIKAGTDLNIKEPMGGSTPLISAATFNKPEIAKVLINAKADLSLKNNDGSTALHCAAFFGRIEIVQLLIDAKADRSIKNNFGATARESVMGNFEEVKPVYTMLKMQLEPIGFKLDLNEVKKARPVVAMMLQ